MNGSRELYTGCGPHRSTKVSAHCLFHTIRLPWLNDHIPSWLLKSSSGYSTNRGNHWVSKALKVQQISVLALHPDQMVDQKHVLPKASQQKKIKSSQTLDRVCPWERMEVESCTRGLGFNTHSTKASVYCLSRVIELRWFQAYIRS